MKLYYRYTVWHHLINNICKISTCSGFKAKLILHCSFTSENAWFKSIITNTNKITETTHDSIVCYDKQLLLKISEVRKKKNTKLQLPRFVTLRQLTLLTQQVLTLRLFTHTQYNLCFLLSCSATLNVITLKFIFRNLSTLYRNHIRRPALKKVCLTIRLACFIRRTWKLGGTNPPRYSYSWVSSVVWAVGEIERWISG